MKKGTYRTGLNNCIEVGRVFLNDYSTIVTDYLETDSHAFVVINGKLRVLTEDDSIIIRQKQTDEYT